MERVTIACGEAEAGERGGKLAKRQYKKQDRIGAGWIGKAWTVFEGGTVFKFHVILTINIMEKLRRQPTIGWECTNSAIQTKSEEVTQL